MPARLQYQIRRQALLAEYEIFIARWPGNQERLPTVMYFRTMLNEIRPDVRNIVDQEMLRFYSDYPFADNNLDWRELFERFPKSPESIEARWRIAMDEAGKGNFDVAEEICQAAGSMIKTILDELSASQAKESPSIFAAFQQPAPAVMTPFKLYDLQFRFHKLQSLLSEENRSDDLAEFLRLNPHDGRSYAVGLNGLLEKVSADAGLRDNLLLAKAMRVDDIHRRLQLLEELAKQYPQSDAGIQAQYERGVAKIKLWKSPDSSEEEKQQLLIDSHAILSDFIEKYPGLFSEQAREKLQTLPQPQ